MHSKPVATVLLLLMHASLNAQPAPPDEAAAPATSADDAFYKQPYSSRNSGSFGKDFQLFSFSYGFPNWLYSGYGTQPFVPSYNRSSFGPVMARFEIAVREEVGVGALVQVAARRWRYGIYRDHSLGVGVGAMGYYHGNKLIHVKSLDLYAGAGPGLSYRRLDHDEDFPATDDSRVGFDIFGVAGARYYFTPSFAAFAEAGYTGFSSLNLGVTLKM